MTLGEHCLVLEALVAMVAAMVADMVAAMVAAIAVALAAAMAVAMDMEDMVIVMLNHVQAKGL